MDNDKLKKGSSAYRVFYELCKWFTFLVIMLTAINIISMALFPLLPSREKDLATSIASDPASIDKSLYSDMPDGYLTDVLTDIISYFRKGLSYFPHSEYCETPFHSKTYNITTDPTGITYREGNKPCFSSSDSSKKRIYVLGGSTTTGLFVADKETWPSQLGNILNEHDKNIEVINYGVSGYSITEEYLRLSDLLKAGHRPAMVIVFDGLNLGLESDHSKFSEGFFKRIKEARQGENNGQLLKKLFLQMPVIKVLIQLSPVRFLKYFYLINARRDVADVTLEVRSDKKAVGFISNRFVNGVSDFKSLCEKYNIEFRYFLQPNAFYNYHPNHCTACTPPANTNYQADAGKIYAAIKTAHADVVDLTDLFAAYGRRAIVDDTHYSPAFNFFLAGEVAKYIHIDSLKISFIDSEAATGAGFNFFTQQRK